MTQIRGQSLADRRNQIEGHPGTERRSGYVRDLEVRVERKSPSRIVIQMTNEFIAHNSYLLDEAFGRLFPLERDARIELEMSRVPYADSEALGRLIGWSRKIAQAGASLALVNPTPYVASIIEILHLDEIMPIVRKHAFPPE